MRLGEGLSLCVTGLIVIAIAGDEIARCVRALAVPGCALIVALIAARLVWVYTSRW